MWRPDFRDTQSLPDTKVIRTDFIVNFLALAITLVAVTAFVFKEYSLQSLISSVRTLEEQVANHSNQNRLLLNQNKRYKQSAEILEEVIAFDRQVLDYPAFIIELSSSLPPGVVLSRLDLRSDTATKSADSVPPLVVELTGRVTATNTRTPSQILEAFQVALGALPSTADRRIETDLIRFNRNNQFGHFDFTLQVVVPAEESASS